MKVEKVEIQNFKGIEKMDVELAGRSIYVLGKNEAGKSSLLDAIFLALDSKKVVKHPLKQGEKNGRISVQLDNGYKVERIIKESGVTLQIETPDGFKSSTKKTLENLTGDISFDVFRFVELSKSKPGRREQVEMVTSLLSEKDKEKIEKCNDEIANIKTRRQEIFKEGKTNKGEKESLEAEVENHDPAKYTNYVDTKELAREYQDRQRKITEYSQTEMQQARELNELQRKKEVAEREATEAEQEIKELELKLQKAKETKQARADEAKDMDKKIKGKIEENKKTLAGMEKPEVGDLGAEIQEAEKHNKIADKFRKIEELAEKLMAGGEEYKALGKKVDELNQQKFEAASKLPIEGLTFDDNVLYLDGLEVDDTVLSTSQIMKLGIGLAMAKNPNFKGLKIPQGESLDSENMKAIIELAEKEGYQMFIEKVTTDEKVKVQIVEKLPKN
jgi:predicted ATP-dependent endonuclease of OLD family